MYSSSMAWAAFRLAAAWFEPAASSLRAAGLVTEAGLPWALKSSSSAASWLPLLSLKWDSSSCSSSWADDSAPSSGEPAASSESEAKAPTGWASDSSLPLRSLPGVCALGSSEGESAWPFTEPWVGDEDIVKPMPGGLAACWRATMSARHVFGAGGSKEGLVKRPLPRPGINDRNQETRHDRVSMMVVASRGGV